MDVGYRMLMGLLSPIVEDPVNESKEEEIDRLLEEKRLQEEEEEERLYMEEELRGVSNGHGGESNNTEMLEAANGVASSVVKPPVEQVPGEQIVIMNGAGSSDQIASPLVSSEVTLPTYQEATAGMSDEKSTLIEGVETTSSGRKNRPALKLDVNRKLPLEQMGDSVSDDEFVQASENTPEAKDSHVGILSNVNESNQSSSEVYSSEKKVVSQTHILLTPVSNTVTNFENTAVITNESSADQNTVQTVGNVSQEQYSEHGEARIIANSMRDESTAAEVEKHQAEEKSDNPEVEQANEEQNAQENDLMKPIIKHEENDQSESKQAAVIESDVKIGNEGTQENEATSPVSMPVSEPKDVQKEDELKQNEVAKTVVQEQAVKTEGQELEQVVHSVQEKEQSFAQNQEQEAVKEEVLPKEGQAVPEEQSSPVTEQVLQAQETVILPGEQEKSSEPSNVGQNLVQEPQKEEIVIDKEAVLTTEEQIIQNKDLSQEQTAANNETLPQEKPVSYENQAPIEEVLVNQEPVSSPEHTESKDLPLEQSEQQKEEILLEKHESQEQEQSPPEQQASIQQNEQKQESESHSTEDAQKQETVIETEQPHEEQSVTSEEQKEQSITSEELKDDGQQDIQVDIKQELPQEKEAAPQKESNFTENKAPTPNKEEVQKKEEVKPQKEERAPEKETQPPETKPQPEEIKQEKQADKKTDNIVKEPSNENKDLQAGKEAKPLEEKQKVDMKKKEDQKSKVAQPKTPTSKKIILVSGKEADKEANLPQWPPVRPDQRFESRFGNKLAPKPKEQDKQTRSDGRSSPYSERSADGESKEDKKAMEYMKERYEGDKEKNTAKIIRKPKKLVHSWKEGDEKEETPTRDFKPLPKEQDLLPYTSKGLGYTKNKYIEIVEGHDRYDYDNQSDSEDSKTLVVNRTQPEKVAPPEITKNLRSMFESGTFQDLHAVKKFNPREDIPAEGGVYENEPQSQREDIVRSGEEVVDDFLMDTSRLKKSGLAKNLKSKWEVKEPEEVKPIRGKKINIAEDEGKVSENKPEVRDNVIREGDANPSDAVPAKGSAKNAKDKLTTKKKKKKEKEDVKLIEKEGDPIVYENSPIRRDDVAHADDEHEQVEFEKGKIKNLAGFFLSQTDDVKLEKKKIIIERDVEPTVLENEPQRLEGVIRSDEVSECDKISFEAGRTKNMASFWKTRQEEEEQEVSKYPKKPVKLDFAKDRTSVAENQPMVRPDVVRHDDYQEDAVVTGPGHTKNIASRFLKQQDDGRRGPKEMIKIERSTGPCVIENQPVDLEGDVVRSDNSGQQVVLETGRTKNLLQHWTATEEEYNRAKTSNEGSGKPRWILEIEAARQGSGVYENEPEAPDADVVRSEDYEPTVVNQERIGGTRKMWQQKEMEDEDELRRQRRNPELVRFTPPREKTPPPGCEKAEKNDDYQRVTLSQPYPSDDEPPQQRPRKKKAPAQTQAHGDQQVAPQQQPPQPAHPQPHGGQPQQQQQQPRTRAQQQRLRQQQQQQQQQQIQHQQMARQQQQPQSANPPQTPVKSSATLVLLKK